MIKTKDYVLREISGIPLLMCKTVPYHGCWMYELNPVGRLIWDVCEKFASVEEMIPYRTTRKKYKKLLQKIVSVGANQR